MIYRLHFDPKGAYWCVQFQRWFVFWVSVSSTTATGLLNDHPQKMSVLKFPNLKDAEDYCADVGIDKAYHRMSTTSYMTAVLSGAKSVEYVETLATTRPAAGPGREGWQNIRDMVMRKNGQLNAEGPHPATFTGNVQPASHRRLHDGKSCALSTEQGAGEGPR